MNKLNTLFKILDLHSAITRTLKRKAAPSKKPPCLPPAKTKRYRVVNVPWQEDVENLLWRRHAYMDAVNSLRLHIRREYVEETLKGAGGRDEVELKIGDEFEKILLQNEELNAKQAELRAEAFEQKKGEMERSSEKEVEDFLRRTEGELRQRELEVEKFIEMSENYVTPENLQQKLLHALENPVDLEFAIDTAGNVYTGNKTKKYLEELLSIETKFSAESAPCSRTGKLEEKSREKA